LYIFEELIGLTHLPFHYFWSLFEKFRKCRKMAKNVRGFPSIFVEFEEVVNDGQE
jgi:hypothetical protein